MKPCESYGVELNRKGEWKPRPKTPVVEKNGIYIFTRNKSIIRVGESGSGFKRIVNGFTQALRYNVNYKNGKKVVGKTRKNYSAYSWRKRFADQTIAVDYFGLDHAKFECSHFRRALEAEVTFQIRINKKAWPEAMCEVHFMEKHRQDPLIVSAVTEILQHYQITYDDKI